MWIVIWVTDHAYIWAINLNVRYSYIREAAKKSSSTNGQAIKALPPPHELNGHRNFKKKKFLVLK